MGHILLIAPLAPSPILLVPQSLGLGEGRLTLDLASFVGGPVPSHWSQGFQPDANSLIFMRNLTARHIGPGAWLLVCRSLPAVRGCWRPWNMS